MPELPEIQALAERVADFAAGRDADRYAPLQFSAPEDLRPRARGARRADPRAGPRAAGKYLILDLGGPRLLVHLSQGGRVDLEEPPKATQPKGAVACGFVFGDRRCS